MFNKMLQTIQPELQRFLSHPLNMGLRRGTLPTDIFSSFLLKDRDYLFAFAKSVRRVAERREESMYSQEMNLLFTLSKSIFDEATFVDSLIIKYNPRLFTFPSMLNTSRNVTKKEESYIIYDYILHLTELSHHAPVSVATASFFPCGCLYGELGKTMTNIKPNNPYAKWIANYSDPKFSQEEMALSNLIALLGSNASNDEQELMIKACKTSAQYEVAFLDSIYQGSPEIADTLIVPEETINFHNRR